MTFNSKFEVLIVDDRPENIDVLTSILEADYHVRFALNGPKAIELARRDPPDLILLDILMPEMDGYQVCKELKRHESTQNIPVIFVTARDDQEDEARGFEVGAVDFIMKPVSQAVVRARVRNHITMARQTAAMEDLIRQRTSEMDNTQREIVRRLGRAAEYKDHENGYHVLRVSHYARLTGQGLGLPPSEVDLLFNAAPMHDVGKLGVPDQILLKQGPLEPHEWEVIKQHPTIGAAIIGRHDSPLLETARLIALTHHEKWEGGGYPESLRGESIPMCGRIVALADVFDVLTADRPYKKAWPFDAAVQWIQGERGAHFAPDVVDAFLSMEDKAREVHGRWARSNGGAALAY